MPLYPKGQVKQCPNGKFQKETKKTLLLSSPSQLTEHSVKTRLTLLFPWMGKLRHRAVT